jgi:uncharacterized linocin/CFP29 family protein
MNKGNASVSYPKADFFPPRIFQTLRANGMKLEAPQLRANTLLRKDEWIEIDRALVQVRNNTLNGVMDLMQRGLVQPLGNLGVIISEWERIYDIEDASVDMSPSTVTQEDTLSFDYEGVPIPIIHKNFRYEYRRLEAARRNGSNLDTTQQQFAARKVFEKIEDILFNGHTLKVGTNSIYGYRTATNRITGSLTDDWDGTATEAEIIGDIRAMLADADDANLMGPFILYVPKAWMQSFRADYNATYPSKTLLQRVLDFEELEAVKPTSALTSDVVLVEMQKNTVDLAVASDVVNLQWDEQAGMITRFKVMGAMAPRIKTDGNDVTGVIHYS